MTISLAGQIVVVTGGARRLGRAVALECARSGADVAITFRTSRDEATRTVEELRAIAPDARFAAFPLDVSLKNEVVKFVQIIENEFGRRDGLGQQRRDFRAHARRDDERNRFRCAHGGESEGAVFAFDAFRRVI